MHDAVFEVFLAHRCKAQAAIKGLQVGLGAYLDVVLWPLGQIVINPALHQLPSQLDTPDGRGYDNPADGALPIADPRGQAALVGNQLVALPTQEVHSLLVEVIQVWVQAFLLEDKHVLAQL
jgi:hypothetical protein